MEAEMSEVKEKIGEPLPSGEVTNKKSWDEALERESWIAPLVDIYETQDDYFLSAQMPGVKKEDVKMKLIYLISYIQSSTQSPRTILCGNPLPQSL